MKKVLNFCREVSLEHVGPLLLDLETIFLIPISVWMGLRSAGEVWQAVRPWYLNLFISAIGCLPDFVLFAVVRLFLPIGLGVIGLLLLFHFSLNLFLLLLGQPIIFTFHDRLAFEKGVDINTTYIFVHSTDLASAHNFLQLFVSQIYDDVLWFKVCVDYTTLAVQVVKSNQDLLGHAAYQWEGDALVVVAFHDL